MSRPSGAGDVRARLDDVIAAMRREDAWDVARPGDAAFTDMGAFGTKTMAFVQWLRWVFVPNVEGLIAGDGPWPEDSQVAVQATREGDTDEHVAALAPALAAFDALFAPPDEEPEHAGDGGVADNDAGWSLFSKQTRTPDELAQAITLFHRAVAAGNLVAITNLGNALAAAGRGDDAVAALDPLAAPDAHNWLGWWFTERAPDLPRAIAQLQQATRAAPQWGVAWLNLAKALDAAGEPARACTALGEAIARGNSHDDAYARDRRVQLELILRARGERPPPPPEQARADTAAVEVLAATSTHPELAQGRTFMILPTQRGELGQLPFAVICVVIERRALAAVIVEARAGRVPCEAFALACGGNALAFRRAAIAEDGVGARATADALADWLGALDPGALTPLDAALAERTAIAAQIPRGRGWHLRVAGETPAELEIADVETGVALRVQARAGGGVDVFVDDATEPLAAPTAALFQELAPAIVDQVQRALAAERKRLRPDRMTLHERYHVLAPFGPFVAGDLVELVDDIYDPHDGYHTYELASTHARYYLSEAANDHAPILAALHRYLARERE